MKLTSNLIYEAALDDELFAALPGIVAGAMGARSCVLHWRDQNGVAEISTHSGYFSDQQMANYAANFAAHDLWTEAGMGQGVVNRAWRTTDLVPSNEYEQSVFYNEWIRSMGDDTFYCSGSVMRTPHGHGIVGLHRGKGQADFSDKSLSELNDNVDDLRRMFAIRAKIGLLTQRNHLLTQLFASGHDATFAVNAGRRILMANGAAENLVAAGRFLRCSGGQLLAASDGSRADFDATIASATDTTDPRASSCLIKSADGAFLIASLVPLPSSFPQPTALLTIHRGGARTEPETVSRYLQAAYGLSSAEADVAMRLGEGQTIREISEQRSSAIGTVRTQVKAVLSKMNVRRQGDVVRTIGMLGHRSKVRDGDFDRFDD